MAGAELEEKLKHQLQRIKPDGVDKSPPTDTDSIHKPAYISRYTLELEADIRQSMAERDRTLSQIKSCEAWVVAQTIQSSAETAKLRIRTAMLQKELEAKRVQSIRTAAQQRVSVRSGGTGRFNAATTQAFAHDGLWRNDSEFRDSATTKEWHEHLICQAAQVQGENEVLQAQLKRLQALSDAHIATQAELKVSLHESKLKRRVLIAQIEALKLEDPDAAAELWDLIYSPSITPRESRSASFSKTSSCDPVAENATGTVTLAGNESTFEGLDVPSFEEEEEDIGSSEIFGRGFSFQAPRKASEAWSVEAEDEEEEEVGSSEIFGRDISFQTPTKASEVNNRPFEVPNLKSLSDIVSDDELSLHVSPANVPESIVLEKYEAPLNELQRILAFLQGGEVSSQGESFDGLNIEGPHGGIGEDDILAQDLSRYEEPISKLVSVLDHSLNIQGQHGGIGEDDILAQDLSRYEEPISKLVSVLDTVTRPCDSISSPAPSAAEDTSKFERPLDELIGALGSLRPLKEFHNPLEAGAESVCFEDS